MRIQALILSCLITSGCSYLNFWSEDQQDVVAQQNQEGDDNDGAQQAATPPALEEPDDDDEDTQQLKQARVWARLDRLEARLAEQKQRLHLLEQGLLLGISPPDLEPNPSTTSATDYSLRDEQLDLALGNPVQQVKKQEPKGDTTSFQHQLASAIQLYKAQRYGKAYVDLQKIEAKFEPSIHQGLPEYWIGKCWFKLGEFQTSRTTLQNFLQKHPDSSKSASAKFFLAKSEIELGLSRQATARLEELIRENDGESYADAARSLIKSLERRL